MSMILSRLSSIGWQRTADRLTEIDSMNGWISPRLGVRFDLSQGELILIDPAGKRFLTFGELALERDSLALERDAVLQERDAIARELAAAQERAERLEAQMRELGFDPQS